MIMAFLDWDEAGPDPGAAAADPRRRLSRRESRRGSADNIGIGLDVVSRGGGENRPVRRGLSKEKRQAMMVAESAMAAEEDDSDWKPEIVPKSPDEVTRIRARQLPLPAPQRAAGATGLQRDEARAGQEGRGGHPPGRCRRVLGHSQSGWQAGGDPQVHDQRKHQPMLRR